MTSILGRQAGLLGLVAAALFGCSAHDPIAESGASAGPRDIQAQTNTETEDDAWQDLPAAERAQQLRALQAAAGRAFALTVSELGGLSATQSDMALHATFERGRVSVTATESSADGEKPIELAVTAWGCAGAMQEIESAEPASNAAERGVVYAHDGFDEWYTVGPAGIEQGLTVHRLPECARRGEKLLVRLRFGDVEGAVARVNAAGTEALLTTSSRRAVHYGYPFAEDAAHVEHAVRIVGGDTLALEIDAADARLPLSIDPLIWDFQQKISPAGFAPPSYWNDANFGRSVSMFGDTLLVGAYGDNDKGIRAGAAYLFKRAAPPQAGLRPRFAPLQKLIAIDAAAGDEFGTSVALGADTAVIGASSKGNASGAAYVFVRNGSTWTPQQKLTPSDASDASRFGSAVALAGDEVIVGAPLKAGAGFTELGAAYAFGRVQGAWSQQRKFLPTATANQASLHFGAAVAIAGNEAAIGRDTLSGGGVDWFTFAGTWSASSTSVSSSVAHFGSALGMNDTTTAIGAYGATGKGAETGAVFVTSTSAPHSLVMLSGSDAAARDQFGFSVNLSASTLLIGAPGVSTAPNNGICSNVPNTGAAYVFSPNGATWVQQSKRTATALLSEKAPDPPPSPGLTGSAAYCDPGERLGFSVATAGAFVIMGAPFRSEPGFYGVQNSGAVFDDEYALTNGSPCKEDGECFSAYCVEGVCCNSACTGPCRSCLAELKDPAHAYGDDWISGKCGEVTVDTDPKNGCTDTGAFCGTLHNCSGTGSCKARNPPGTACTAAGTCATDTSVASQGVCSNFTCAATFSFDCQLGYRCKAGACLSTCKTDDDCDAVKGYLCKQGQCKVSAGAACLADTDCVTGVCKAGFCGTASDAQCNKNSDCLTHHCVDSVCCDTTCEKACQACNAPGSVGSCTAVSDDGGDPPGSCVPQAGSAGQGGGAGADATSGGSAGAGGASGVGAMGGAVAGQAGGGAAAGGASGRAGASGVAGQIGRDTGIVECIPTCGTGLVCDHETGHCQDQLVTACGCRAAGGRGTPSASVSVWLLALLGAAVCRRRR